jgi:sigma-E factor negative regulatory protein RseC
MFHKKSECRVVTRPGVVIGVRDSVADVEIVQQSACVSCTLKSVCGPGEHATRIISARPVAPVEIGASVELEMEERWGVLGTVLAFVVPLAVVVATYFGTTASGARDEIGGLLAVAMLIPYYFVLSRFRGQLQTLVTFIARPTAKEGT